MKKYILFLILGIFMINLVNALEFNSTFQNGLLSYWSLDVNGSSNYGTKHLTEYYSPTHLSSGCKNLGCYNFSGWNYLTNATADTGSTGYPTGNNVSTINLWWKINQSGKNGMAFTYGYNSGQRNRFIGAFTSNRTVWGTNSGTGEYINNTPFNESWHMITYIKFVNNTNVLFIDGIKKTFQTSETSNIPAGIWIGTEGLPDFSYNFTGMVDEVMIWNRTLGDSEILDLWNGGTGLFLSNFTTNFTENSQTFNLNTVSSSTEIFSINLTYDSSYYNGISAYLVYNNTNYSASTTDTGDVVSFSKTITIPTIVAQTNKTFYWTIALSNITSIFYFNSTSNNQSINLFGVDNCTTYTVPLFNMTLYDEDAQTILAGVGQNTSIKLSFTIKTLDSLTSIYNVSYNQYQINPARICLQNNLSTSQYRLDGIIEYSSLNRFTEFYNIQNYTLNNLTSNVSIKLYDLNNTNQEFKITYKDSNFVPVSNALLNIQRKYVDEGVYKTIEVPKTNAEGYTIAHLIINNAIYNIIVYKEGKILATFEDIIADCQNPLLSSCSINLNSYGTGSIPSSFENQNDITFNMNYDETTRIISSLFVIPSGATSTVTLNVTLFDGLGNTSVCNNLLYASGGTLSCTVPSSFGNTTVISSLFKDGKEVGYSVLKLKQKPSDIYGSNLILIALLVFLVMIGIGATSDSPMVMGIMVLVGSIVLVGLNLIYTPSLFGIGATILWFIICIILMLIKGANR